MKYETSQRVNFGVFSSMPKSDVAKTFAAVGKKCLRRKGVANDGQRNASRVGTIWCLEVNGSGRGGGVIAADDKVYSWKDKFD